MADLELKHPIICLSKAPALFTRHRAPTFTNLCAQTPCPSRLVFKQPFSKKLFLLTQEKSQPESSPDLPQHSRKMQSQAGRRGVPSGYSSTRGLGGYSAHGVLEASVPLLPPAPRVQHLGLPAFLFSSGSGIFPVLLIPN